MSSDVEAQLTPGQQLKQARIAKGVTLAQISERTLILSSRLDSLEKDDYAAAGGAATYVVGYVKLYAGIVGLDSKSLADIIKIIDAYFEQTKLEKKLESYVIIKPTSRFPWLSIAAALLAVVVFIGLGQWFFSQESKPLLAVDPLVSTSVESPALMHAASENIPLVNGLIANIEAGNDQSSSPAAETSILAPKPVSSPASINGDASVITSKNSMDTAVASNFASVAIESSDQLVLSFNGDCWVEIFDATQKKLFSRLVYSGELISLIGAAPFDVKVGNASAIKLSVNGRAIDLNPPEGQRVLRLQVGP
ncbi:MAG: DUF4115 domain-containing protein [Marinagarivorans sp.]|nr:DUF4115 domain-containing protein [Marinagarivorans sp.]